MSYVLQRSNVWCEYKLIMYINILLLSRINLFNRKISKYNSSWAINKTDTIKKHFKVLNSPKTA